jgi:serine/threonine protein kinase
MATAAESLEGIDLPGGWHVDEKIERPENSTGGNFSVGYLVSNSTAGGKGYLKALDFSAAFEFEDPARALESMTAGFNFEREVLQICQKNRLNRIVLAISDGVVKPPGTFAIPSVNYLIFELADCDIRARFDIDRVIDVAWRLRSLHHTATGLSQLHRQGIAHQDLKPSNVLVFEDKESKIADLGRAAAAGRAAPHDGLPIAGDTTYAPPELLYGYVDPEWSVRRFGCDAYHLGSMALFFFSQVSMTSAILNKLARPMHPKDWKGTFQEALPYLTDAFDLVIGDLKVSIRGIQPKLEDDLSQIIRELCEPNPQRRGDPETRNRKTGNPFSLERYVSRLDRLAYRASRGLL